MVKKCASLVTVVSVAVRRDLIEKGPTFTQANVSIGSVRHPISKFMSGIDTVNKHMPASCESVPKHALHMCEALTGIKEAVRKQRNILAAMKEALNVMKQTGIALMFHEGSRFEWKWAKSNRENQRGHAELSKKPKGLRNHAEAWEHARRLKDTNKTSSLSTIGRSTAIHIASQMYILNLHPPETCYDKSNDPSVNEIDALVRLEHIDDGIADLTERFPNLRVAKETIKKTVNRGHLEIAQERIPCSMAWAIYDYFVQDFVCLGYEMPEECLKEECKVRNDKM